nr:hypothetical protein [Tanacetum cinerariifolium]
GSCNGGDEVEADIGKSSSVPNKGASDLVGESMKGGGLGGGAGDNTGEGGDSIGVVVEKESEAVVKTKGIMVMLGVAVVWLWTHRSQMAQSPPQMGPGQQLLKQQ